MTLKQKLARLKELLKKSADEELTDEETTEVEELETELDEGLEDEADNDDDADDDDEVVVDDKVSEKLVSQAKKSMKKELAAMKQELSAKFEASQSKNVNGGQKGTEVKGKHPWENMPKEKRLVEALKIIRDGDKKEMRKFSEYAVDTHYKTFGLSEDVQTKAGYMNETTDGDGGFLVPDAEFITDILKAEEDYGVAAREATTFDVTGNTVKANQLVGAAEFYETDEWEEIPGIKLSVDQDEATLRKFAAIAPWSNELDEDSSLNIYNMYVQAFAEGAAKKEDELMFTDPSSGIINQAGVLIVPFGTNMTDVDADEMLTMADVVPTSAEANGKYYFNRHFLTTLRKLKNTTTGEYIFTGPVGTRESDKTIWGYPYTKVSVMRGTNLANESFVVFGNLKRAFLARKRGIALKLLTEATIKDANGTTVNLGLQDGQALRAVIRRQAFIPQPGMFSVGGTGTVS